MGRRVRAASRSVIIADPRGLIVYIGYNKVKFTDDLMRRRRPSAVLSVFLHCRIARAFPGSYTPVSTEIPARAR